LPPAVDLVVDGAHAGSLTGPRTAREYGVPANADAEEAPRALDLAPGTLPDGEVLRALDRGVVVGNLWYLNYSDRAAARITGMTRFATFWVEQGRVVGPLAVMRFDDTLYRMLGTELEALGDTAAFLPSTSTYGQRSVESQRLPGALLRSWTLTL
ncbi:MAG: TldD/PmbA family protein, partial [Deltaproteobacteria bacterium]|nr:TldD/PmbA family protein [Deltaproteobacteria bacterium]